MHLMLSTTVAAFFLSLVVRVIVETFLAERIPLLGNFVGLEVVWNAGVAFGITFPPVLQTPLVAVALLLVVTLAYRSRRSWFHGLSFGLILGGALANIVDRFDDGLVTDFIQVGSFPTFNIADSCITVGVGVLLLWEVFVQRHKPQWQQ